MNSESHRYSLLFPKHGEKKVGREKVNYVKTVDIFNITK